jgi:sortase (surface protein transpeptidase)
MTSSNLVQTPNTQSQAPGSKHQRLIALVLTAISLLAIGVGIFLAGNFISQTLTAGRFFRFPYVSRLAPEDAGNTSVQPTGIYIKTLKINAPIVPVGLAPDDTLQVPEDEKAVGWYIYGALPGDVGTSVITGHLDTTYGPAVFWHLKNLRPGDSIEISRSDGSKASFRVDSLQEYSQDNFPIEQVYGKTDSASLRLITCSGTYNKKLGRYSNNLVVYASLVDIAPKAA